VPGGDGALFPFWSPDSRSIGFFANGKLKVVDASPSPPPPRELADVIEARGGSWGANGTIIYSPGNFTTIMQVPAAGGTPSPATTLDRASGELAHRWPRFLPDGRRFLYESRKPSAGAPAVPVGTYLGSLDGKEKRLILSDVTSVSYSEPGYLLFRRANTLMAVACDPKSLEIRGDPIVLTSSLEGFAATGLSLYSARGDLLIYSPRMGLNPSRMVWLDRAGKELSTVGPASRFTHMALSTDGRWAVTAQIEEPLPPDLWVFDTTVGRGIRLTRDALAQVIPIFSPDGRIVFSSFSTGPWDLWEMDPQGGGRELKTVLTSATTKAANDISPDGRWLIYREFNPGTRGDLRVISLTGDRQPGTFMATINDESNADFSPDGGWVAYSSDESGRKEIYAVSFPDPTRRFRVTSDGGSQPRWSRDGKEIFYLRSGQMNSSLVGRKGDDLTFGESRPLFSIPLFTIVDPGFDLVTRYDVAPDGRFLALLRAGDEQVAPLVLVQNWREALEPAKK
jgi:Tol biopolymer transport system component